MSDLENFIKIREEFSSLLEPASIEVEQACWEFYINSNDKTQKVFEKAEDNLYQLYSDKIAYEKFKAIKAENLPKHEAKQLKDIIKSFEEELNSGDEKKALRKKEAEIGQKYNTYVAKIDDKPVTKVDILKILQTDKNPDLREKAYNAKIKGGDLIANDLIELVKMRNSYAMKKGYKNYFEYMIKEEYDVEPEFLNTLIDNVYSKTKDKIKYFQNKKQEELKSVFNLNELKAFHYGLILDSNPEKAVNKIIGNKNVEEISKKIYSDMGYDISKLEEENKITLDLYPRKGKNTHGFCFSIEAGKDSRILANLMNNVTSLETLNHELGHCVYDLGLSLKLPFIERRPSSSAITEAVAMMMGDIAKKENCLKELLPQNVLEKFKESLKEDDTLFVSRSLLIIDFERELYNNPEVNPQELWSNLKEKYSNRKEPLDNEWATIPHYLTHPGYYQNYFRAVLMKAQIYNKLHSELGYITENNKTAQYLDNNLFAIGASIDEYELIKQFTGKEFSVDDFVGNL